mmetsp:Transcript_14558/g.34669  ORF Transcript_14558/g.34669 Transcript_14558/m.34669 type:complete len:291 (-) Transcript_14558:253-1125(-)
MPKRATHTYESEKDGVQDPSLNVHYCMCCGESVLILGPGIELNSLPRRKTDCAYVLEKGTTVFKLKSKPGQTKLLRRPKGFERQYRLNCWNCNVPIAYKSEDSDSAKLTYVLFDATGLQADLYLQLYQVPPCIQPTGERSVRVALEVSVGQAKKAITHVSNAEIGISVCAPSQEGLANSEVIDHMTKVLGVPRQQLQLSRGWSQKSKFLLVSNMTAVEVFKAIRGSVETDILPISMQSKLEGPPGQGGDDIGPAATAGAASSAARNQWEQGEELDELAMPPSMKQQTFRA